MKAIPLLMTVHEFDGSAEVWFEPSSPLHTELLASDPDYRIKEGDWVMLLGRVQCVKRSGGYERGSPPPAASTSPMPREPVSRHEAFSLETAEIYFGLGVPDGDSKNHAYSVRRKR